MEGLPVTAFDQFDWDGATAACMSCVCRPWYHNIRREHCLRPGLWFHRGASFCVHFKAHGNRRILYDDITKDVVALRRKRNREWLTEAERNFIEKRKRNNPVPLDLL